MSTYVGGLTLWSLGGSGVVIGRWAGDGPWSGGLVGCLWWHPWYLVHCHFLHSSVTRVRSSAFP